MEIFDDFEKTKYESLEENFYTYWAFLVAIEVVFNRYFNKTITGLLIIPYK